MSLQDLSKEELLSLFKEAFSEAVEVHPLTSDEVQWVRLAIKAEVERAAFRKAVIEKSLVTLIIAAAGWIGLWLVDVFHTYFQSRP